MNRFLFIFAISLFTFAGISAGEPWRIKLHSPEEKINIHLDLYEESIEVPGMEMFGPMNGYMNGNIYGVWSVTSFEIMSDKEAVINLSNDLGSETQKTRITQTNDSTWMVRFEGTNVVKRVNGKKLVKIPSEIKFRK